MFNLSKEQIELYNKTLNILKSNNQISTPIVQRTLKLSYFQADNIMQSLEQNQIIGPKNGASMRDVLIELDQLEKFKLPHFCGCKLKVSHFPQVPCKSFEVEVPNEQIAYMLDEVLAQQHIFLYNNQIIPDYSNVIIVEMWNENEQEWEDYWNEDEAMEWNELIQTYSHYFKNNFKIIK